MLNADDVIQLYEGWKSALANGNVKALDVICDTNFLQSTASGALLGRSESLEAAASGDSVYESWTSSAQRVRFYGTTAILNCRDELQVVEAGVARSLQWRCMAVFFHKDGSAWKLVGVQATPVSGTDS